MENIQGTCKKLSNCLSELRNFIKEGKDRNYVKAKEVEEQLRLALDVPKESWIPECQSLKDLVENISRNLTVLQNSKCTAENIPDEDVLKNASGGLALEGVYRTGDLEGELGKREQLIELPESFSLHGPQQSVTYDQVEFSSRKSERDFQKAMEKFAFSSSLKVGFMGFALENRIEFNKFREETRSVHYTEKSRIVILKYSYVPLASGFIDKDKLKLSNGALKELIDIEKVVLFSNDNETLEKRVVRFFEIFGSHANQGPLHFGGVFWWKASAEGLNNDDHLKVKNLMSDALSVYVGAAYKGISAAASCTQLKGFLIRNQKESLMSHVHLSIQKTGGPAKVDDHLQWKSHLVTSNRTWSVIDRGTTFVPVWEILMLAHIDVFKNALHLATTLRKIYRDVTKQSVEPMWGGNVLPAIRSAKMMIQTVKGWTTSESDIHLSELLELKNKLKSETGSHSVWTEECLSSQILQDFLVETARAERNDQAVNLRILMRALLEPLCAVKNFPSKNEIMKWAYKPLQHTDTLVSVSEFSELIVIVKQTMEELENQPVFSSIEEQRCLKMKATCTVTLSLNSFCQSLRDSHQDEVELLVSSILHALGYSRENKIFNHLLSVNEIDFLQKTLQNRYSTYCSVKEQSEVRAQAYLFHTALTVSVDGDIVSSEEKKVRAQFIKSNLKCISDEIESAFVRSDCDWKIVEAELMAVLHEFDMEAKIIAFTEQLGNLGPIHVSISEDSPEGQDNLTDKRIMGHFAILLQKLGLTNAYPKKLKTMDVLLIDHLSLCVKPIESEKQLKSHYLYKLMMLDYRARYVHVKCGDGGSVLAHAGTPVNAQEFFYIDEDSPQFEVAAAEKTHIHPMDVHMAVFHCANDFLRQYIFKKLSTCQFALPFLVPNICTAELEFPLWPLRHIKRSWQSTECSKTVYAGKYQTRQMFSTPVPTVTFIRLGRSSVSKSHILNAVFSKHKHNVFFDRHCEGYTPHSVLMDGVVEIAWYCPGGKIDDIFDDCIAFLNLHGDAKEHLQQLDFLQAVSTVNVVLLSEDLQDEEKQSISKNLLESPVPLICLFSEHKTIPHSNNPIKVRLAAKNRNEAELTEEIIGNIKICIEKYHKTTSIEQCSNEARKRNFSVDVDKDSFREGYAQAQVLVNLLKQKDISEIKKNSLPLQGDLWHKWCIRNKEQFRLQCNSKESIEQQLNSIVAEMKAIRQKQWEQASPLSDFMSSFLKCLMSADHSEDTKLYMVQWLTVLLHEMTSDTLARLDTAAATVGLQHIMREISQLYEAAQSCVNGAHLFNYNLEDLPAVGAEMLISGHPLELMDGDVSHVPLIWIEAVLEKVIEKLGDKKVYVLSVLGIQSSGKSTLLNTMFGLQFAVSAGRCTRGAFMQLLKVDLNVQDEFGFDFLLVVDTEGLRSPELSSMELSHDNELATFIIGIGDMTVINIMGENPSEMQEILQICVQAFLRMKKVMIKPSCVFVHQNIPEASAGDKTMEGRRRLQERLDKMSQIVAEEERIEGVYSLSDIIKFDVETEVFYFKHLWEGDPPMAPPNPSYSENVQDLKTKLLSVKEDIKFSLLSGFKYRISDFWNALLQEDFVFSYTNILEVRVHSNLEKKYSKWKWELTKKALELQHSFCNQIGSNLLQELNITEVFTQLDEVYNPLKVEIEEYFKEEQHADVLINWKENISNRFDSLKFELVEHIQIICQTFLTYKKSQNNFEHKKSEWGYKLAKFIKELASNLKDKCLTESQLEDEFESVWVHLTMGAAKQIPPESPVNVKDVVENVLIKKLSLEADRIKKAQDSEQEFLFVQEKYTVCNKSFFQQFMCCCISVDECNFKSLSDQMIEDITQVLRSYVMEKEMQNTGFSETFVYEMLSIIESKTEKEKFTNEYMVDLSVYFCRKYVKTFQRMDDAFRKTDDLSLFLESSKGKYLQMFKNYCKGAHSVTVFTDFLCKTIQPAIRETIHDKCSVKIVSDMKTNIPAFNANRSKLDFHILKDLAVKENFSFYDQYFSCPKESFRSFFGENVRKFCRHQIKLPELLREYQQEMKCKILDISTKVSNEFENNHVSTSTWVDKFCNELGKCMVINRAELNSIQNENIQDVQFLKDTMVKSIDDLFNNENMRNFAKPIKPLYSLEIKIEEILLNQLEGCWAQCPFCGAICTNTISGHDGDHSVNFHRPIVLGFWRHFGTEEYVSDFCTTLIKSDKKFQNKNKDKWISFKSYREAGDPYDRWSVTAEGSQQSYWKWFICRFQAEIESWYGLKFADKGEIPEDWHKIKKESVLKELCENIQMEVFDR